MPSDPLRSRALANRRRALALVATACVPWGVAIGLIFWWGVNWVAGILAGAVAPVVLGALMWWGAEPLARRSIGGRSVDAYSEARLVNVVDGLCATVGTRKPELRVREEGTLNAAVCGRRRSSATLVVTRGLLDQLNRVELEGVVAQQLTRIRCYDMLPATVTVATLGIFATMLSPPEPVTAMDRAAVHFTRYPPGLISALEKMTGSGTEVHGGSRANAQLWLADPGGAKGPVTSLKDRVMALREL